MADELATAQKVLATWFERHGPSSDTRRVLLAMDLLAAQQAMDDTPNSVQPGPRRRISAQETYELLVVQGITEKDLAAVEGVSVQAIKMRLYRARKSGYSMPRINANPRDRAPAAPLTDRW